MARPKKKQLDVNVTSAKPKANPISKKTYDVVKTCRWCNVKLKDGEPYQVGWIIRYADSWLSIQGHRACVQEMFKEMEAQGNG